MTRQIVVVGAGGLGREVLDVIEAMHAAGEEVAVAGVADDRPSEVNLELLNRRGYTYLGTVGEVASGERYDGFVIGIGSPSAKRAICDQFEAAGWTAATVIHPDASVGSDTSIEVGVIICAGARVTTRVLLERHSLLNLNVTVGHDTRVGAFAVINPGAHISGDVALGDGVLIGTGAVVLQGLTVGDGVTVGANACVTKDVDRQRTVVGVPARPLHSA